MSQQETPTDKISNEPNPKQPANKTWVDRQKKKCLQKVTKYYWGMANGFYCGLAGIFAKIAGSSPTGFVFYLTNWVNYFPKKPSSSSVLHGYLTYSKFLCTVAWYFSM
jgi:hypothetical protein